MPVAAELPVENFRFEVPGAATEAGAKETVTPAGIPLTERLTAPLNPFNAEMVSVEPAEPPTRTLTDAGDAERAKSGAGLTARLTLAVCDKVAPLALAPVIVIA